MKTVRVVDGVVREVIPDYALPVKKFYGAAFAAQCVQVPDEVEQRWILSGDGTWSAPSSIPKPAPEPTSEDRVAAQEDALVQTDEVAIELYETQMVQEEINAAQDEALIELYEMMEV